MNKAGSTPLTCLDAICEVPRKTKKIGVGKISNCKEVYLIKNINEVKL